MELDLDERVPPVRPRGTDVILRIAERFLQRVAPQCLAEPVPVDLDHVVSEKLFDFGIDVYPADDHELTTLGNEGYTQYEDGRVVVVLKERQWTALTDHGFALHRARTTVGHELGHAVLHRDVLEQMAAVKVANPAAALHRVRRRDIKPYCDPEWQAWAFCGGILLPREALRKLHGHSLEDISREFQVSLPMIRSHLRKLGRFGFQVQGGLLVAA